MIDAQLDISLLLRQRVMFQNDGAPCHYAKTVRNYLDLTYPGRWIGRGGPIAWAPRSPDLNPVDFFVWGYYKEFVYHKEYDNISELNENLREGQDTIRHKEEAFQKLRVFFLKMSFVHC